MPARAISPCMPTPMAARAAITTSRAIRICSTRPGRSTAASPIRPRRRAAGRSAARISSTAASSAPRSRRTIRCIIFPASTAPITRPGSTRARPRSRQRANIGPMPRRSRRSDSGPAPPITSTTRSGSPMPPIRRRSACGKPSPTRSSEGRVEVQLMPFNARFATVTTAFGLQASHQKLTGTKPRRSDVPAQRPV